MEGRFSIEGVLKQIERVIRPVQRLSQSARKIELWAAGEHYEETVNPLFVFHAIKLCHDYNSTYPKFVTNYLLESANLILSINDKDDTEKLTLKSLGFTGDNINRSKFKEYQEQLLKIDITLFAIELREHGYKPGEIDNQVAKKYKERWKKITGRNKPGPSYATIKRYLDKYDNSRQ